MKATTKRVLSIMVCLVMAVGMIGFNAAAVSSSATLSSLSLGGVAYSPAFSSVVTGYSATVPNATSNIIITPTAADNATIKVNGTSITTAVPSVTVALTVGSNAIPIAVTSEDTTTVRTYTLTVTRLAASTSADLSALSLSSGTLSPQFSSSVTAYTACVNNTTTSITVTPTSADSAAVIKIGNVIVPQGTASAPITLAEGNNTIQIYVYPQVGAEKIYTVTVNREDSALFTDADLSGIALSSGTLAPAFMRTVASYSASVPSGTASITVTPTPVSSSAVITVNAQSLVSGKSEVALSAETTTISIAVTVGSVSKTYTVTVTKASVETPTSKTPSADLRSINLPHMNLRYMPGVTSLSINVPYSRSKMMIIPKAVDKNATITINGQPLSTKRMNGGNVVLAVGENKVTIVVTSGTLTKTYTLTIVRAERNKTKNTNQGNGNGHQNGND